MFDQIKSLLKSIQEHKLNHKVTIFNKQKNNLNKHSQNVTEGKLLDLLKNYQYFNQLNHNLGAMYLLRLINHIEPYFLRQGRTLVNMAKQSNQANELVVIEGVLKLMELVSSGQHRVIQAKTIYDKKRHTKSQNTQPITKPEQKFIKYISNGHHINMAEYKQDQFRIISYENCQMLKLPNKSILDPIKRLRKSMELFRQIDKNTDFLRSVQKIKQMNEKIRKYKKDVQIDPSFGLGQFDYNQLVLMSQNQNYSKGKLIHQKEDQIQRIGLILKGKVMQEDKSTSYDSFVSSQDTLLTTYKKDFSPEDPKKTDAHQFPLEQGEWVGLEEYLDFLIVNPIQMQALVNVQLESQESKFKDVFSRFNPCFKRQISTVNQDVEIMWIPLQIFARKFNYQVNYALVDRWATMISIKKDNKKKNDDLKNKFNQKNSQPKENFQIELPKLAKQKLKNAGHQLQQIEEKTELRTQIFISKNKRMIRDKRESKITANSLLGITMADSTLSPIPLFEPKSRRGMKSFSTYTKETLNKKYFVQDKSSVSKQKRSKTHRCQNSFTKRLKQNMHQSPEDLIMYPQAYQAENLPPNLKKQLIQSERLKGKNTQSIDCHLKKSSKETSPKVSRKQSLSNTMSPQNHLSNMGSTLNKIAFPSSSKTFDCQPNFSQCKASSFRKPKIHSNNSPQRIHRILLQRISFKHPHLQAAIRANLNKKKVSLNITQNQMSTKERIQSRLRSQVKNDASRAPKKYINFNIPKVYQNHSHHQLLQQHNYQ